MTYKLTKEEYADIKDKLSASAKTLLEFLIKLALEDDKKIDAYISIPTAKVIHELKTTRVKIEEDLEEIFKALVLVVFNYEEPMRFRICSTAGIYNDNIVFIFNEHFLQMII